MASAGLDAAGGPGDGGIRAGRDADRLYLFVTIEPDKVADIVYHLFMVVVLITGIVLAVKLPRNPAYDDTDEVTR